MLGVISAIETLRIANSLLEKPAYRWILVTDTSTEVTASSGMKLTSDTTLKDLKVFDLLLVCGSFKPHKYENKDTQGRLRRFARHGKTLGSLESGVYHLALAGVLDGFAATAHFISLAAFQQMFPKVRFSPTIFTFSDLRMTCAGGMSPIDLMLHLIRHQLGKHVSARVANLILLPQWREPVDLQHDMMTASSEVPASVRKVCTLMEENIENPVRVEQLAVHANVSRRQLDRLFQQSFNCTVSDFYMLIRLSRARKLLRSSCIDLAAVGEACGFAGYSHFSRSYKRLFKLSPREERRRPRGAQAGDLRLLPVFDLHPEQNLLDPHRLL